MARFAGVTFDRGLYRVHTNGSATDALGAIAEMFPARRAQYFPFAYDWLGRQCALDFGRVAAGEPQVVLLDPGAGEVLQVPASFESFHEDELIEYQDAALAADFLDAWREYASDARGLQPDECVGYRVPLFLGGADEVHNLERSDMSVYWSICAQLFRGATAAGRGESISGVAGD
ncbi:MAG: DUF1851 domain-containing protein [Leifsonia xyli]|nr:MAG: DUF1851 domain-containing protein [Leifsonia xyli]